MTRFLPTTCRESTRERFRIMDRSIRNAQALVVFCGLLWAALTGMVVWAAVCGGAGR